MGIELYSNKTQNINPKEIRKKEQCEKKKGQDKWKRDETNLINLDFLKNNNCTLHIKMPPFKHKDTYRLKAKGCKTNIPCRQ